MRAFSMKYFKIYRKIPHVIFAAMVTGGASYLINKNLNLNNSIIAELRPTISAKDSTNNLDLIKSLSIFSDVAESIKSSVVFITMCDDIQGIGNGSGFIIDESGYILTNAHLVERHQFIITLAGGQKCKGKIFAIDSDCDLAIIKIETGNLKLQALKFADSSKLRIGQFVIAFGNPLKLDNTVTVGVMCGVRYNKVGGNYILTDTPLQNGSSGSALVNLHGDVVGIVKGVTGRGLGIAVPSNRCKKIFQQALKAPPEEVLVETKPKSRKSIANLKPKKKFIGIEMSTLDSKMDSKSSIHPDNGVVIHSVFENSPAQKNGIVAGDIIISINGVDVYSNFDVLGAMAEHEKLDVVIMRDGKEILIGDIIPEIY